MAARVIQIGAIAVVLAASTRKTFELDRFFVPKEAALHLTAALAALLALRALRRTTFTRTDTLLGVWLLLSAASAALATNGWVAGRALAISVSGALLFWTARALRDAGLSRPLLGGIALAIVLAAGTALLQTYGVRIDLFSLNRAPGGTLGNRNFIAHAAAFGLPLLLLVPLRARSSGKWILGSTGVALVTAALVLTRSRAAWLAFGAVALVALGSMFVSRPLRRDLRTWRRLAGIVLFAGGGVAAALMLPNTLRWRSDNPYLESVRRVADYQEGSGRGRLIQYERSLRMALSNPILGVGPGNWAVEYADFAARNDPSMNPSQGGMTMNPWPSSDWVASVAERGPIATLLLAIVFATIGLRGLGQLFRAIDIEEALVGMALVGTVAAAVITGAFDAVLLLALPSFLVWTALGALWIPPRPEARAERSALRTLVLVLLIVAAGAGAARSAAQLVAMEIFATSGEREALRRAARIDPGNYRVQIKLARGGKRDQRCEHARAAYALYPNADAAESANARCE
jgi:O-antigen ligase